MSIGHGSKIVTDSLAFMFDMSNTKKSWRGEPTTNLVNQPTTAFSNWSGLTGSSTAYTNNENRSGVKLITLSNGGVQWYNTGGQKTITPSTVYTVSANIKYLGGTPHPNLFYIRQYNSSGSQTSERGQYSSTYQEDLGDGWYRAYRTFTSDSTAVKMLVQGYEYTGGKTIYIDDVQLERKDYHTPYVEGTRSNTEAIKDLMGTATITAESPTYNSGNTFTFNSGTQRLNISNSLPVNNNFSWSAWIRSNNIAQVQNIVSMNGPYFMRISNSRVRFNILTSSGWLFQNGTTLLSSNTWYHFCMVWNGTNNTWSGYINGTQEFSVSKSGTVNYSSLFGYVGYTPQGGEQSYFNGDIPVLYYHNKALTNKEVERNFEAHRSRYNV